jgi:hypothetical protein
VTAQTFQLFFSKISYFLVRNADLLPLSFLRLSHRDKSAAGVKHIEKEKISIANNKISKIIKTRWV